VAAADMMARYNQGYSHAPTAGNNKLVVCEERLNPR
jgi:hypothetical protein